MTIENLWNDVIRKGDTTLRNNLAELRGKTIGIDAGMIFHKIYATALGARSYHQVPHIPLDSVFEANLNRLRSLTASHDIKLVFVCDGLSNELKKEEDNRRGMERDAAMMELRSLYALDTPSEDDLATATKLTKSSCKTTDRVVAQLKSWAATHPDDVRVYSSLFEADQQLASMCKDDNIQGILAEDGDFLCSGAPLLITSLDYTSGACQIYKLKDVLLKFGPSFSLWDFQVFCTFSGCDYLKRPIRLKPLDRTLEYIALKSPAERKKYLEKLEAESKYGNKLLDRVPAKGYSAKFSTTLTYWEAAPVVLVVGDMFGDSPPTVSLGSLGRTYDVTNFDTAFGFSFSITTPPLPLQDMFFLNSWGKTPSTISVLKDLPPPMYTPLSGGGAPYPVVHGAIIDFSASTGIPVPYQSTPTLQMWLTARGVGTFTKDRTDRSIVVAKMNAQFRFPSDVLRLAPGLPSEGTFPWPEPFPTRRCSGRPAWST